jgi:hypothetical protein
VELEIDDIENALEDDKTDKKSHFQKILEIEANNSSSEDQVEIIAER